MHVKDRENPLAGKDKPLSVFSLSSSCSGHSLMLRALPRAYHPGSNTFVFLLGVTWLALFLALFLILAIVRGDEDRMLGIACPARSSLAPAVKRSIYMADERIEMSLEEEIFDTTNFFVNGGAVHPYNTNDNSSDNSSVGEDDPDPCTQVNEISDPTFTPSSSFTPSTDPPQPVDPVASSPSSTQRLEIATSTRANARRSISSIDRKQREWYYTTCFLAGWMGGFVSLLLVPVDMLKCRIQVGAYSSLRDGFRHVFKVEARRSCRLALPLLFRGWVPTVIGSTAHSSLRLLLYEFFKSVWLPDPVQRSWHRVYAEETAQRCSIPLTEALALSFAPPSRWVEVRTFLFAATVSEFLSVVLLAPWETIKVQMQTRSEEVVDCDERRARDPVASSTAAAVAWMWQQRAGLFIFYRGLVWLWLRQIPYTIAKFFFFEITSAWLVGLYVYIAFRYWATKSKGKGLLNDSNFGGETNRNAGMVAVTPVMQLCIALLAGLIAGMLSALVSHPADTLLSRRTHSGSSSHARSNLFNIFGSSSGAEQPNKHDRLQRGTTLERVLQSGKDFLQTWKGLGPRVVMIGLLSAMQWTTYSMVKVWCGFSPFEEKKKI